jgi:RNA polymerase sigma-70 factor (ECF subfamily)
MMGNLEELVQAARCPELAREQRHSAFGHLVELFQGDIYGRAYHTLRDAQLAQDVTQETFLTAYQQLAQLREPRAFPGWLQQILRTHCNRIYRKTTLPTSPLEAHDELADPELDPAQALASHDVREAVLAAIATLPEHERTVVQLFYFQGFSLVEIAERLMLPTTTIKKRLQYARERLRERITTAQSAGVSQWQILRDRVAAYRLTLCFIFLLPLLVPCPVLVPCRAPQRAYPRRRYEHR